MNYSNDLNNMYEIEINDNINKIIIYNINESKIFFSSIIIDKYNINNNLIKQLHEIYIKFTCSIGYITLMLIANYIYNNGLYYFFSNLFFEFVVNNDNLSLLLIIYINNNYVIHILSLNIYHFILLLLFYLYIIYIMIEIYLNIFEIILDRL